MIFDRIECDEAKLDHAKAGRLRSLGAKSLIVLTADFENSKGWMAAQNEMATLSTNSLHRVVSGATHASFVENPDHAAAVTRTIHDVVVSCGQGNRWRVLERVSPSAHRHSP